MQKVWNVGDPVIVKVNWGSADDGTVTRVQGKHGTVVEVIERDSYPYVVDINDSIVGRAAFNSWELEEDKSNA